MYAVVTGAAGFIGSTLTDALLASGTRVLGIDCFTPYYPRADKERNLAVARGSADFEFVELDLRSAALEDALSGADAVFHHAAQPGVRLSWDEGFEQYSQHNVVATQRLLEAAKRVRTPRLVYASSSSVYGNAAAYPTTETDLPRPHSPYGVTKLAGEHLCSLYSDNWGLSTIMLRYFTVYGPRQRPDMAIRRLIEACLAGTTFPLFGDGGQVRDFTYVDDVVGANVAAVGCDAPPGTVVNIAGGSETRMADLIDLVGEACGRSVSVDRLPEQPGDVARTGGAIALASRLLDWAPRTPLADGVRREVDWCRSEAVVAGSSGGDRDAADAWPGTS